jgi:EAL domain-containing protein (putative c-di-GMP-specific phosphodiesterase class I)/GGDEF domain-containing protein
LKTSIDNVSQRDKLYCFLQEQLERAQQEDREIAIVLIKIFELNHMEINIGFPALELVSKRIQSRLLACTPHYENVIQTAIDGFLVVVPNVLNRGHLAIVAERISREIKTAIRIEQETIELEPSIGIASAVDCKNRGQSLYNNALLALENGRLSNQKNVLYDPQFSAQMKKVWDLKKDIEAAIHDNQFELYFQPKVALRTMTVEGAEALIRWKHPLYGMVKPDDFIPIAEQSGQIHAITEWVIKSACQQLAEIIALFPDFKLSINVTANNLSSPDLMLLLEDTISIWNVPAKNMVIEVTETTLMSDIELSISKLERVRELGFGVSIDDFGTGYSSLAYFKQIPATELKIDKSFIDSLVVESNDKKVVSLIIFLAKQFDLRVVAEGVESKAALNSLVQLRCDYAQGYYFARPLPLQELFYWMTHNK